MEMCNMEFEPKIILPENLEITFSQEILDWIKENICEMKYIIIKKYRKRDEYDGIMRINIQKNSFNDAMVIYENIYKVLQYFDNIENNSSKYKISIYKNNKVTTRYVIIEKNSIKREESN